MAAEINAAGKMAAHRLDGGSESLLIWFGASARRRPVGARLAEGEIAAEDGEAGRGEGFRQGDEQQGVAVCSCSVGEDEAIRCVGRRVVEDSANGCFA